MRSALHAREAREPVVREVERGERRGGVGIRPRGVGVRRPLTPRDADEPDAAVARGGKTVDWVQYPMGNPIGDDRKLMREKAAAQPS